MLFIVPSPSFIPLIDSLLILQDDLLGAGRLHSLREVARRKSPALRTHPLATWRDICYYFQVPGDADFVELVIVIVPQENFIVFGLCKYQECHHKLYIDWHVRGGPVGDTGK
jgi:hypothetical protein